MKHFCSKIQQQICSSLFVQAHALWTRSKIKVCSLQYFKIWVLMQLLSPWHCHSTNYAMHSSFVHFPANFASGVSWAGAETQIWSPFSSKRWKKQSDFRWTDGPTDRRTKPLIELLFATNKFVRTKMRPKSFCLKKWF